MVINIYLWCALPFPACKTSASTIVSGLSRAPYPSLCYPTHCLPSFCGEGHTAMILMHWTYNVPCRPEAAEWIEQCYSPSREVLPCKVRWTGRMQSMLSINGQYLVPSLIARRQRPRDRGVGMGVAPLNIIPNNLLGEFLLSIPSTLRSVGLESVCPKEEYFLQGTHTCFL